MRGCHVEISTTVISTPAAFLGALAGRVALSVGRLVRVQRSRELHCQDPRRRPRDNNQDKCDDARLVNTSQEEQEHEKTDQVGADAERLNEKGTAPNAAARDAFTPSLLDLSTKVVPADQPPRSDLTRYELTYALPQVV